MWSWVELKMETNLALIFLSKCLAIELKAPPIIIDSLLFDKFGCSCAINAQKLDFIYKRVLKQFTKCLSLAPGPLGMQLVTTYD